MRTSYQVLCRVAMRHAYFADGQLRGLVARPTATTAERLRRAGLLLRPLPAGFEVVYAGVAGGLPPAGLRVAFPLVLSLHPPSPDFELYTDLPGESPAPASVGTHVRYLAPVPAAEPRLHQGAVMGGADQLPMRPLAFQLALPAGVSAAALHHYPDGPVVWEKTDLLASEALAINLRAEGSGAYALRLGEAPPDVFFAADFAPMARPWAMLELGAAVLTAPGATYELSLAARATYWQYQLVSSRPLPAGLVIDAGTAAPAFEEAPALPGVAASFRALVARPLAERYPSASYRLVLPEAGRPPRIVCAALPHASPAGLRIKNNPINKLLVTDIFVLL